MGTTGASKSAEEPTQAMESRSGEDLSVEDEANFCASTPIHSAVADAMETTLMRIECGFMRGFAGLQLIGNTSEVCKDGKERARAALEGLGLHIPPRRLVVSLTPADLKKDGNHLDLPIAVSLALLLGDRPPRIRADRWLFAAELGLRGELRPVRGAVSFAVQAMAAGLDGLVLARDNLEELAVVRALSGGDRPLQTLGFASLAEVLAWLREGECPQPSLAAVPSARDRVPETSLVDFDDMILTPTVEQAVLAVAAGRHSLLMRGTPGTGKSMLAARLPSILPELERDEHLEAMRIYSAVSERLPTALLVGRPPFRAPHHSASAQALVGSAEQPGELALAHGGVLFLDELPEFRRDLLEMLREPLETGEVRLSRSRRKVVWKARVLLVGACNNCPCGWAGSARRACDCSSSRMRAYRLKLSGPVLDRIDIHLNMPDAHPSSASLFVDLADVRTSTTTQLRERVVQARRFAAGRNRRFGVCFNRDLPARHLVAATGLSPAAFADLVDRHLTKAVSNRAVLRCLRVARTLADLDESETVRAQDLAQAWAWQAVPAAEARGDQYLP